MDEEWKELFNNPPLNWQEKWNSRRKLSRFDTKEKAERFKENYNDEYNQELFIDLHVKDGYIVYYN